MKVKNSDSESNVPSVKKIINTPVIIIIITVLLVVAFFFLWQQKNNDTLIDDKATNEITETKKLSTPNPPIPAPENTVREGQGDSFSERTNTFTIDDKSSEEIAPGTSLQSSTPSENASAFPTSQESKEVVPPTGASNESEYFDKTCKKSSAIIKQFYSHLDSEEYIKQYGLKVRSEEYFTVLIQRLLDNPPVVSGEMNDLFTILQNTAHFFRIIGKSNILLLKGILDREKDRFEIVLAQFYSLIHIPSCAEKSFNLNIPQAALTDYAGFFLNTMGGRLYLFRRDSMSRMVVSYYAILLIDKANKEARNKHGIEIKNAIDQLITEIEATTNQLHLKDTYLDNLYSLKEQYQ